MLINREWKYKGLTNGHLSTIEKLNGLLIEVPWSGKRIVNKQYFKREIAEKFSAVMKDIKSQSSNNSRKWIQESTPCTSGETTESQSWRENSRTAEEKKKLTL